MSAGEVTKNRQIQVLQPRRTMEGKTGKQGRGGIRNVRKREKRAMRTDPLMVQINLRYFSVGATRELDRRANEQ